MEKNLTTGSVFKNLLFFSLAYLLSYFLQPLYGMADLLQGKRIKKNQKEDKWRFSFDMVNDK